MSETRRLEQGLVQVYTGSGKGKTTASLGLALRAVGHGLKVYVLQFLKGGVNYGELAAARRLAPELTIERIGRETFVSPTAPAPEDVAAAEEGLERAREILLSGDYDLVILDEINCALAFKLVSLAAVADLIRCKPAQTELVLTGRGAPPELLELADLVTEMREIKHYFHAGQGARVGIES